MQKQKIKGVVIVTRGETPTATRLATEVATWLIERRIRVYSHPKQRIVVAGKTLPRIEKPSQVELGVVLGGDGTYLEAVRLLQGHKIPIIGVNLGSLGFLTVVPREDLYSHLLMALDRRMEMRSRSVLDIKVKFQGRLQKNYFALNDAVLERAARSHLIYFSLYSEKQSVCDVKADGVIVASPTGSTAYNLAAGGPILHPDTRAFVITPICPHSLTNRPMIFPDSHTLVLRLKNGKQSASLTIDGKSKLDIDDRHEITIQRSKRDHYVLRPQDHNYFKLLAEKLKFAQRA